MSVLVTVAGPAGEFDLELDDERPLAEILPELAEVLGAVPPVVLASADGTPLDPAVGLADAGVLDGQRLRLLGTRASAPGSEPSAATPAAPAVPPPAGLDVLPCYLALDTSDSMTRCTLDAVNAELGRLVDALRDDPRTRDQCRLAVLGFDAEARVIRPLTPIADLDRAPRVAATRPATDYEAVFRLLRCEIDRDLESLRAAGLRPLRPAVLFLTDGRPTRGYWPAAHEELTEPGWEGAADILAFGFGDASERTIRRIGTAGAYLPAAATVRGAGRATSFAPAAMLSAVMTFVLDALGHPATGLAAPASPPPGWRSLQAMARV